MLDKMKQCPVFDDESQDMLYTNMERIEDLQREHLKHILTKACK